MDDSAAKKMAIEAARHEKKVGDLEIQLKNLWERIIAATEGSKEELGLRREYDCLKTDLDLMRGRQEAARKRLLAEILEHRKVRRAQAPEVMRQLLEERTPVLQELGELLARAEFLQSCYFTGSEKLFRLVLIKDIENVAGHEHYHSPDQQQLGRYFDAMLANLPRDNPEAAAYGQRRAEIVRIGTSTPTMDKMVAESEMKTMINAAKKEI